MVHGAGVASSITKKAALQGSEAVQWSVRVLMGAYTAGGASDQHLTVLSTPLDLQVHSVLQLCRGQLP
jgi:hypothetical protein